ncbi:hypothetical protein B0J14DRAFT_469325 [Halenospora varia]|nr:hypothetical protein B0J14DRAFT_469325 [Halenospora varia]
MILKDVKAVQTITTKGDKLTEDALAKASGFIPRNYSNSFEAGISDAGVGELPEEPKGSVLWKQGKPAEEELLDWDGSWLPPPCDWDDRGTHDKSYMPSLIQEWQKNKEVPCGPGFELDTSLLHYKNGHPPCNGFFSKTDESPVCIPDIENSEDEQKRLEQTSKSSSENFVKNQQKNRKFAKEMAIVHEIHNEKILALEPEVDLYSPKIDVYLRPAGKEDSAGIAMVYNHHIATTFITEDQAPVTEDDIEFMIENAKKENLPFIVAIRGQAPRLQDSLGRRTASKKAAMPKCEMVIGFATAEIYNYGLGGARTGRSRSTANLMLYVHPEYKRKGVGRNLLDRLVHNMSPGYGYRKACSWLNPENDTVHESGGPGHFHQILFQLPVLPKDDPNLAWIKNFLYNGYFFTEEARLKSIGRSRATPGPAKWLDVVVFQGQAYQAEEFDPHDYCLVAGVQRSA